jgi:pimeloyl-ACP methyl ester carboxylesterase|tara:strand:- start:141 stop:728 length:588 start_codon:yes stop_codon:yes gene_type:complete
MRAIIKFAGFILFILSPTSGFAQGIAERVEHKFADSDGASIHYVKAGEGPLMVFIHGFPDYWYSWRNQMEELSSEYTVVAMDTRGYNKSDSPVGVENYDMEFLVRDVEAVIKSENRQSAIIVGHDWGGAIAWSFASANPEMTEQLIIVNLPYLKGLVRELAEFGQQHANSQYARNFQQANSHESFPAERFANGRS